MKRNTPESTRTKKTKPGLTLPWVATDKLSAPPEPYCIPSTIGLFYLIGNLSLLGVDAVMDYIKRHPVIATKNKGGRSYTVVGNFRTWEMICTLSREHPGRLQSVPVLEVDSDEKIADVAAENLIHELLVQNLPPEYLAVHLSSLWRNLPEAVRNKILPAVKNLADFSDTLGFESRTGFDNRRLNRIGRASDKSKTDADLPEPIDEQPEELEKDDDAA